MSRRMVMAAAGVALTVAAASVAAIGFGGPRQREAAPCAGPALTVPISRQTLVRALVIPGEVGFGESTTVLSRAAGTLTWLPQDGTVVERGAPLLKADEVPTILLYGMVPMYRQLGVGATGTDIRQFEENLRALGYGGFTVDLVFGQDTSNAVKRWQAKSAQPQTGVVDLGRVVYAPGPLRVSERLARVGGEASGDVMNVTGTTKLVVANVPVASAGWAVAGASVTVLLPEAKSTPGQILATKRLSPQGGGEATVEVTVSVADQSALSATWVDLHYVLEERKGILAVPVAALLALPQGGYGLELEDGRLVQVQTGMFSDGQVEVRGDGISEGQRVGMPR